MLLATPQVPAADSTYPLDVPVPPAFWVPPAFCALSVSEPPCPPLSFRSLSLMMCHSPPSHASPVSTQPALFWLCPPPAPVPDLSIWHSSSPEAKSSPFPNSSTGASVHCLYVRAQQHTTAQGGDCQLLVPPVLSHPSPSVTQHLCSCPLCTFLTLPCLYRVPAAHMVLVPSLLTQIIARAPSPAPSCTLASLPSHVSSSLASSLLAVLAHISCIFLHAGHCSMCLPIITYWMLILSPWVRQYCCPHMQCGNQMLGTFPFGV